MGLCFQSVEAIFDAARIRFDDLDIPALTGSDPKQNGEMFVDLFHGACLCRRESLFCFSFILRAKQFKHRYFSLERRYTVFLSWHRNDILSGIMGLN